jgi:peptidoglycan/LPS O-acetylase OafA/YrhL
MFFGTGLAYALIAKKMGAWAYKAGVGLALAAGFVMGWANMVHMSESENPAYLVYFGVIAAGGIGAWLARLEARGMARVLFAMAAALAVVTVIAAMLSSDAPPGLPRNVAVMHGVLVALFTASGLLFRHASLAGSK